VADLDRDGVSRVATVALEIGLAVLAVCPAAAEVAILASVMGLQDGALTSFGHVQVRQRTCLPNGVSGYCAPRLNNMTLIV
jgi:hypothetical protein